MSGVARTSAAITLTNALPTGVGCAAGIGLHAEARVSVTVTGPREITTLDIPDRSRSPVVEESLRLGLARYFPATGVAARLALTSEIPVARGLKSSSAVSTAILLAVARAAGRGPPALEIGRISAEVGKRAGVSATGALDDALAGIEPGFVVTDNLRGEVIRRADIDPDWGVALYIPSNAHPPSPSLRARFSEERSAGELAARAATSGDWATAMQLNTELVERAMGYSYAEIRGQLRRKGAVACGVSGLGPAVAAIAPWDRLDDLVEALPSDGARKLVVPFTRGSALGGDGA